MIFIIKRLSHYFANCKWSLVHYTAGSIPASFTNWDLSNIYNNNQLEPVIIAAIFNARECQKSPTHGRISGE